MLDGRGVMESFTDPKMLEGRAFFKIGQFTFDHRKKVLAVGILACFFMASLITMGPDWAEAWGEGELESVEALDIMNNAFADDSVSSGSSQGFIYLVHHEELNDSSETWQQEVVDALAVFFFFFNVDIQ